MADELLLERFAEPPPREYLLGLQARLSWMRHPLTVLVLVGLTAAAVALTFDPQAWPPAIVCGVAVVVGLVWPRLTLAAVTAETSGAERRGTEGEPLGFHLRVANRAPWNVHGLSFDVAALEAPDRGTPELVGLDAVGASAEEQFLVTAVPRRRGYMPRRPVQLATGFPFGLEIRRKSASTSEPTLVRPRTWPLVGLPTQQLRTNADDGPESRRPGDCGTTLGLRLFRRGDSPRDVHWPQSARCGELIVRERAGCESARVAILVDVTRIAASGIDAEEALDWIVRGTASLARHLDEAGTACSLVLPSRGGFRSLCGDPALDALAEVELDERASDTYFAAASRSVANSSSAWFVTTRAGYARLTRSQRETRGYRFFLVEVTRETSRIDDELPTAGLVYLADIPIRAPHEYRPGDAFHVRNLL
jgi:uncharacterized protein (DUF58 family)